MRISISQDTVLTANYATYTSTTEGEREESYHTRSRPYFSDAIQVLYASNSRRLQGHDS